MANTGLRLKFEYDGPPTRGASLVEQLLASGQAPSHELSTSEAEEAVAVLEQLESLWFVDQMVEGGEMFAGQVHTQTAHGLQELVQNADDHGASRLRMAYRAASTGPQLLVAHDGKPVDLRDVILMSYALLSGSREDPERIGRFGIGLKTLNQITDRVSVHCLPFKGVEISGGHIRSVRAPAPIKGLWSPQARETLFVLRLNEKAPNSRWFKDWLTRWDASSLVFLRTLRSVTLVDAKTKKTRAEQRILTDKVPEPVALDVRGKRIGERTVFQDANSARRWTRYTVDYPTPRDLRRTHKASGETMALGVAVPDRGPVEGRLFAGLPLDEHSGLPFSLAAPFDINVSRTKVLEQDDGFNGWLIDRLGDTIGAVALERFARSPKSGWKAVPITGETAGEDGSWLAGRFSAVTERIHERLGSNLKLKAADGSLIRAADIVFESQELDGLLTSQDLETLDGEDRKPLPKRSLDGRRSRDVLWELGASRVDPAEAIELLKDETSDQRGGKWLVDLAAAAIRSETADDLWQERWVVLAGGNERLSPAEIAERGVLLVHGGSRQGLAHRLKQARPLGRAFVARTPAAETVRKWLTEREVLRRRPGDEDALRALARADGADPIDLRQDRRLLLRLRDAIDDLSPEKRAAIGPGIGRNILLRGYRYRSRKPVAVAAKPFDGYLPSKIEKHEGWLRATNRCEGITWIHNDYAEILRVPSGSRRIGALAFLRILGAGVAPHLESATSGSDDDPTLWIDEDALSQHQLAALNDFHDPQYFLEDWTSPDLERVIADIIKDRAASSRRARARALFLALHNNWREYDDRAQVVVARWHRREHQLGTVPATWIARAASEPWLSSRSKGLDPKAPRELFIDTGAGFGNLDPGQYADEIEPQFADSPAAEALGLRGRFSEDDLVNALEQLRGQEEAGDAVNPLQVGQIYAALSSYRRGENENRRELTDRQLQARFGRPSSKKGLVRVSSRAWLPPARVRRGPALDARLPSVTGADALWDALGIEEPDIRDCIDLVRQIAADDHIDSGAEFRIFDHLLRITPRQRAGRSDLRSLPLRTKAGWRTRRPIFAIENPAVGEALADKLAVWDVPMPVERVRPLLRLLSVDLIDESEFEPAISSETYANGDLLRPEWQQAVEHFREFLTLHRPDLGNALTPSDWQTLRSAELAIGSDWSVRVPRDGRAAIKTSVPAFLFLGEPMVFAALGEDYAESLSYGGQAVASAFGDLQGSDRVFLAMAWETAFRRRHEIPSGIFAGEEIEDSETNGELQLSNLPVRPGRTGKRRRKKRSPTAPAPKPVVRELVDPDDVDISKLSVSEAGDGRKGKVRLTKRRGLKKASPTRKPSKSAPKQTKTYGTQDSEEVGFRLMQGWLEARGIHLEDTRNQQNVGADGVDLKQDFYFELKSHARDPSDQERFESSEIQLARKKKDRYWLVIASGLEKGLTPKLLFIQNPLAKLDAVPTGGTRVSGILSVKGQRPPGRESS